jgi:Mg-chelatase subunit ChlI
MAEWAPREAELSDKIAAGRQIVDKVEYSRRDLVSIAALTSSLQVDGHRADLVILKAARAQAAFEGRNRVTDLDIALAAELALPHRIRRGPFQQAEIGIDELQDRISQLQSQEMGDDGTTERGEKEGSEVDEHVKKKQ